MADSPTALIVDDDPILRMLVRRSAERAGFSVVEAASLRELCQHLEQFAPAVVVLDLNLGDAVGKELLVELAQADCSSPLLPLTGLSEWEVAPLVQLGLSLGLDLRQAVHKPVSSTTLTQLLGDFLA